MSTGLKYNAVETLQKIAAESVDQYVVNKTTKLMELDRILPGPEFESRFESCLETMKQRFRLEVPWCLYDKVARRVLLAIAHLVVKAKSKREKEIASRTTEVVINLKLKTISFESLPQSVRIVLWENLSKVAGLKVLDFGNYRDTAGELDKYLGGAEFTLNLCSLVVYDCADNTILTLTKRFPKLQELEIKAFVSVHSIKCWLKCAQLRRVRLKTSLEGFAEILLGFPYLERMDILEVFDFGYILEHIHDRERFENPFAIRTIPLSFFTTKQLSLLGKMCPRITQLDIRADRQTDLTVLAPLTELRDVRLCSYDSFDFYARGVKSFFESCGSNITRLYLEGLSTLDLQALMCIGQFCPQMESMVFCNSSLLKKDAAKACMESRIPPFAQLQELRLHRCKYFEENLEYLLSYCLNIKFLQLPAVRESTMKRVLAVNPMSRLEDVCIVTLYMNDQTIKAHVRSLIF